MSVCEFTVIGIPVPQGSKKAFVVHKKGGAARAVMREDTKKGTLEDWRHAVAMKAREWQEQNYEPLMDGPLALAVTFRFSRPKSKPSWKLHVDVIPDASKLLRAVEDALTGVLIRDDSRFTDILVRKRYCQVGELPGADVRVEHIPEGPGAPANHVTGVPPDDKEIWAWRHDRL